MIEVEEILGCPTETVHIHSYSTYNASSASDGSTSPSSGIIDVVLVPGNPGSVVFYLDFLLGLQALYRASFPDDFINVHSLSHANHHLKPSGERDKKLATATTISAGLNNPLPETTALNSEGREFASYGLEFQNLHTLEFISKVLRGSKSGNCNNNSDYSNESSKCRRRLFLIGHSIGAFIILDNINRLNLKGNSLISSHLSGVIMLMPFIFWRNIPMYHRLALNAFVYSAPCSSTVAKALSSCLASRSSETKRWAVSLLSEYKDDPSLVSTVADRLICDRVVSNFLSMGMEEILAVPEEENRMMQILKDLHSSCVPLCFLYTDNDVWAPKADMSVLKSALPGSTIHHAGNLSHAFTLRPGGSDVVLGKLASFLIKLSLKSKL